MIKVPEKHVCAWGAHCRVRSLFMYLIAKAKGRTTQTCSRALVRHC